eukprot:6073260-Amphidinium_carterae.5
MPVGKGKGATRKCVVVSTASASPSSSTRQLSASHHRTSSLTVPLETSSLTVPLETSSLTLPSPSLVLSSFIGLTCQAGTGLIDTGTQTAVIGKPACASLEAALRARGLRGLEIKGEDVQGARGIGGQATILSIQQVPIDLSKVPGVMLVQVLDQDVPLLLPIGMLRKLVKVLDFDDWTPPAMHLAVMQQPGLHVWHSMLSQVGQVSCSSKSGSGEAAKLLQEKVGGLSRKSSKARQYSESQVLHLWKRLLVRLRLLLHVCMNAYHLSRAFPGNVVTDTMMAILPEGTKPKPGRPADAASPSAGVRGNPGNDIIVVTKAVRVYGEKHESMQQRQNLLVDMHQLWEAHQLWDALGEDGLCPSGAEPSRNYGVGRHSQLRFMDVPSSYAQWAL